MEQLPLDPLELFMAVAEAGSFSAAASRLGLPKSSVSRGIARLEKSLNRQLIHRTTRRVALSTAGVALYERAAPHLRSLRQAVGSLPEGEEQPSGHLRITAPSDVGSLFLAEIIPLFVRRYPEVSVDVRLTGRRVDLVAEGFDLAIRALVGKTPDSSLIMRRLSAVQIQLFAAPSYLARRGTPRTPEEAREHDWVLFRDDWPLRQLRLARPGRIVCDDYLFVRGSLRAGAGIGALPTLLAQPEVAAGTLVAVLPRLQVSAGRIVLLYPRARHLPRKLTALRDFLIDSVSTHPLSPRLA